MAEKTDYDIAVIGGGLAGLAASILLSQKGYKVVLFEKEAYPFHKVCGEYISMESWNFLESLTVPLSSLLLPRINTLRLTAPNGKEFATTLPLGGFGISRYLLDKTLASIAVESGVTLLQKTKVEEVKRDGDVFQLFAAGNAVTAAVCCAAYGKRSNLDVKWNRPFLTQTSSRLNNYVGIKYHLKTEGEEGTIGLHNFNDGYCGISKIEAGKHCLCYMTKAENLRACGGSIERLQETVLYQNPHLKKIFLRSNIVQDFPVTISQISFSAKAKVENGVLMLGDAAGMITPLCGNGMSIALHTAKMAATQIDDFLQNKTSRRQMEAAYQQQWKQHFAARLQTGRMIQSFFGSRQLSNFLSAYLKPFLSWPALLSGRHMAILFKPVQRKRLH